VILKLLISVVFVCATVRKFNGTVAPDRDRCGYSRQFRYANGIAELVALVLLWWAGFELTGAAGLGLVLLGGLATLIWHREGPFHLALTPLTLLLVMGAGVPVNGRMTWDGNLRPAALAAS
jgi:hypothetical protein